ncbi:MAG: DUF1697 domain-containing protein [Planctomycetales bacterium]|nr:DUF1697 domain-containing protein [Planctomycetales bacterium]
MAKWIALFRGVNVGGKNTIPMAGLRKLLETIDVQSVKTYIQSGNVVFESSAKSAAVLGKRIGSLVEQEYGFHPQILVLPSHELAAAVAANPFPEAEADPKSLHLFFLESRPRTPDIEKLDQAKKASEAYVWSDRVFYLHAPEGVGRSKLAASIERYLGVTATARNFRTVKKVLALADASS